MDLHGIARSFPRQLSLCLSPNHDRSKQNSTSPQSRQQDQTQDQKEQQENPENPSWPLSFPCRDASLCLWEALQLTHWLSWKHSWPLLTQILGTLLCVCTHPACLPLALWSDLFIEPPREVRGATCLPTMAVRPPRLLQTRGQTWKSLLSSTVNQPSSPGFPSRTGAFS